MMMILALIVTAALSVAIGYALRGPEVSEMRSELCNTWIELLGTRRELDAARHEADTLRRQNDALHAAAFAAPAQPESIAAQTAAKIAAEREEESNQHGVIVK